MKKAEININGTDYEAVSNGTTVEVELFGQTIKRCVYSVSGHQLADWVRFDNCWYNVERVNLGNACAIVGTGYYC